MIRSAQSSTKLSTSVQHMGTSAKATATIRRSCQNDEGVCEVTQRDCSTNLLVIWRSFNATTTQRIDPQCYSHTHTLIQLDKRMQKHTNTYTDTHVHTHVHTHKPTHTHTQTHKQIQTHSQTCKCKDEHSSNIPQLLHIEVLTYPFAIIQLFCRI